jgi:hypothetical protein
MRIHQHFEAPFGETRQPFVRGTPGSHAQENTPMPAVTLHLSPEKQAVLNEARRAGFVVSIDVKAGCVQIFRRMADGAGAARRGITIRQDGTAVSLEHDAGAGLAMGTANEWREALGLGSVAQQRDDK